MKLEKVIIDGKEYYREIKEEAFVECTAESQSTTENEPETENLNETEEEFTEDKKEKRDAQIFFEKVGKGARDVGVKIFDGAKKIGNRITVGAKDLGAKMKEGTERLFNRDKSDDPNSTEAKLLRLLPYMSSEDAHEFCRKLIASDEMIKKVNVAEIMPFVSKDDCDALFLKCIVLTDGKSDVAKAVPYVSKSCLALVVDDYINGKYPDLDMDALYPFLSDEEIKKIFYHIIGG